MAVEKLRMNGSINVPNVRVIDENAKQLGILETQVALATAEQRGYDLVEVSPQADPPVCKFMDYGKYQYQQKKRMQEAKKKQTTISVKEVKFRPRTDVHDFEHKLKNVKRFIADGDKVKVKVFFRGREMIHPEIGEQVIIRVIEAVKDLARVEAPPKIEGRQMTAVIGPLTK